VRRFDEPPKSMLEATAPVVAPPPPVEPPAPEPPPRTSPTSTPPPRTAPPPTPPPPTPQPAPVQPRAEVTAVQPGVETPVLPGRKETRAPDSAPAPLVKEAPKAPKAKRAPMRFQMERQRQDPVSVEAVEQPAELEALGQSATDGQQGLFFALGSESIEVAPGSSASLTATIVNKGSIVEGVDVAVLGVPKDWVRIEPPNINLFVGGESTVTIHVAPPRSSTTRPGPVDAEVAAWSRTNPKVRCGQRLRLVVGAYRGLDASAEPSSITTRRRAHYEVRLANRGNDTATASVAVAASDPRVRVLCTPTNVSVSPGAETAVTVAASARPTLTGPQVTHKLPVTIGRDDSTQDALELTLVQDPLLSKWTARAIVAVLVLALLGSYLWVKHDRANARFAIPNVVGQQDAVATAKLRAKGFDVAPTQVHDAAAAGTVLSQDPKSGERRKHHTLVTLTESSGPAQFALPDVAGKTADDAEATLTRLGLKVDKRAQGSATVPANAVISQSPAANTPVTAGQTVTLTISSGPQPVKVPSVLGLLETKADDQLTAAGLVVDTKTVVDPANAGRVVAQNPRAGTSVQQGTTVTITVATSQ